MESTNFRIVPVTRKYVSSSGEIKTYITRAKLPITNAKRGRQPKKNKLDMKILMARLNEEQCAQVSEFIKNITAPPVAQS